MRVVGGAYGGFCDFDTHSGMFTYSSYRDPNLLKTVDVYDGGQSTGRQQPTAASSRTEQAASTWQPPAARRQLLLCASRPAYPSKQAA